MRYRFDDAAARKLGLVVITVAGPGLWISPKTRCLGCGRRINVMLAISMRLGITLQGFPEHHEVEHEGEPCPLFLDAVGAHADST